MSMAIQTFHLSPADKKHLEKLLRKGSLPAKTFKRATGLLELDRGRRLAEVATTVNLSPRAVSEWRRSYATRGLGMLVDEPRSGRPIVINGSQRAGITALACSTPPQDTAVGLFVFWPIKLWN